MLFDHGGWAGLPAELKVHCLRPLPAGDALAFAAAGRDALQTAYMEDLWLDLFHRDWRWLCPGGLPHGVSFRQHHVRVSQKAMHESSAFVVLGGSVRNDGTGHADAAVLSALSTLDGEMQWRSFALPVPGRCAAGLCHGWGQLISVGGFDFSAERAMTCVETLDVSALLRGELDVHAQPRLLHARACPGVVVTPEAVLAVGGGSSMFTAAEAHASVEALPHISASTEWRQMPSLLHPRCAAGVCATAAGHVFVVSGFAGYDRYEHTVEWADATGSEGLLRGWQLAPALAHARAGCVASYGPEGCVWVLGGGWNESESLDTVERLDPRASQRGWICDVPPMPGRRRCFAGGFGIDGKLYVYGGWDSARWHDPTAARLDLRAMRWEALPTHFGEVNSTIPYHFVSGCVVF